MPRTARVIAPGYPHHIIQRGNRRQRTFFSDADYAAYIDLMGERCRHHGVDIWAYCLMPNHVHLLTVAETGDSLRLAIGEAHRRYEEFGGHHTLKNSGENSGDTIPILEFGGHHTYFDV